MSLVEVFLSHETVELDEIGDLDQIGIQKIKILWSDMADGGARRIQDWKCLRHPYISINIGKAISVIFAKRELDEIDADERASGILKLPNSSLLWRCTFES